MQISKPRLIEPLIIVSIIIIGAFIFFNAKNVHLKFYNKTGEDIDSLIVAGTYVGKIKKDSATEFIQFKKLLFENGIPYDEITGIIKNRKVYKLNMGGFCASGKTMVQEAEFSFNISLRENDGKTFLILNNFYD